MMANLQLVDGATHPDSGADAGLPGALLGATVSYTHGYEAPATSLSQQSLTEHLAQFGRRPVTTGSAGNLLRQGVQSAGLTGHGGGHFPVATKWLTHLRAGGGGVVIANGAESEPASVKDKALMQLRPHLVLDGLACVAEVVAAEDVVIWLHEGAHCTERALRQALAERRKSGFDDPAVRIVTGPRRYLSGESSAIVNSLSGGTALPQFRRVPAAEAGVSGRPTLVHNVETLCRIARVAYSGASNYHHTTLLSVAHDDVRTLLEIHPTTALDEVVAAVTGMTGTELPQAVLIGGYGGSWHSWEQISGVDTAETSLRAKGIDLGAGVVIPVAADECGLAQAALIADYLSASSARQCGPCLFGLKSVSTLLGKLVGGDAQRRDIGRLTRFLSEVSGRGACHHPDGAVRMIGSALATFAEDVAEHLRTGHCLHPESSPYVQIPELAQ